MIYINRLDEMRFSYDIAHNSNFVVDLDEGEYQVMFYDDESKAPEANLITRYGTFASSSTL